MQRKLLLCFLLLSLSSASVKSSPESVSILVSSVYDLKQLQSGNPLTLGIATNQIIFDAFNAEFNVSFMHVPLARQYASLNRQNAACVINKIKTKERIDKYVFSLPVNAFLTLRLYQRTNEAKIPNHLLDENGDLLSLGQLFSTLTDKQLLLITDNQYPSALQQQLDEINPAQIQHVNGQDLTGRNLVLIERERANFALDYPQSYKEWYLNENNQNTLRNYRISGLEPFVIGHLMCNQQAQQNGFLKAFDSAIQQVYSSGNFKKPYQSFLPEEALNETLEFLDELYAQPSPAGDTN